ncbi:MAG: terminase [Acidimicrobiales bacterium]|nr:terminase [Acidimicrobiales bacterium]
MARKGLPAWDPLEPWPTLGGEVVDWVEAHCVHGPGDVRGQPAVVRRDVARFLWRCYEVHPRALCGRPACRCVERVGRRRYSWAVLSRIKGTAKSEVAAWVVLAELLAPVRFDGWDADGVPVGRPVTSPYIPVAAVSEDQADDTLWGATVVVAGEGPLADVLDVGLMRIIDPLSGGEAKIVTSSSISRDGGKPSFTAADEGHLWFSRELRDMDGFLRRNLAKRPQAEPWGLSATTMFRPGQGSVAEQDWERAGMSLPAAVRERRAVPWLLFDHREAGPDHDTSTDDGLRCAVADAAGDADWLDLDRIVEDYRRDPESGERFWLNRRTVTSDQAVDPQVWASRTDAGRVVADREQITLGFDGSKSDDQTWLVATTLADGWQWPVGWWAPDGSTDSELRMRGEVRAAVAAAFARWRVVRMYADPPYWADEIAEWRGQWGDKTVLPWETYRDKAMAWAVHQWAEAIHTGTLTHSGDGPLAEHVANARRRDTRFLIDGRPGWTLQKERPGSPRKIDGAVTSVLSWRARTDALSAGLLRTDEPRRTLRTSRRR